MTKKDKSLEYRYNVKPDGKFSTTAPTCVCGTIMNEHYVSIWHDKYLCPKCSNFTGVPNTKTEYEEEKKK